jgi:hypothetical protein
MFHSGPETEAAELVVDIDADDSAPRHPPRPAHRRAG